MCVGVRGGWVRGWGQHSREAHSIAHGFRVGCGCHSTTRHSLPCTHLQTRDAPSPHPYHTHSPIPTPGCHLGAKGLQPALLGQLLLHSHQQLRRHHLERGGSGDICGSNFRHNFEGSCVKCRYDNSSSSTATSISGATTWKGIIWVVGCILVD